MTRVALIQMSANIGDVTNNVAKAKQFVERAIAEGAELICLPELFHTGYFCHTTHCDPAYFDLAETVDGVTLTTFRDISRKNKVTIVVPIFEYAERGVYYNSAFLVEDGEIIGCYRKTHIPWSMTGWEKFYMRPGYDFPVFTSKFAKIGMLICYDRDFPEAARSLALKGANIIFIPNASGIHLTTTWKNIVQVRAYENQVFVAGACLTGRTDEEHHAFCGHSLIADPFGNVVERLAREEDVLIATIDFNEIERARRTRFLYRDRRPEIYEELVERSV